MSTEYEKRLTTIEVNLVHISEHMKELTLVTKNGLNDFTTIINNHVEDDLLEHKQIRQDIQKNKDFRNRIIWGCAGAAFILSSGAGVYKLFF